METSTEAIIDLFEDIGVVRSNVGHFVEAYKESSKLSGLEQKTFGFKIDKEAGKLAIGGDDVKITVFKTPGNIALNEQISLSDRAICNYNNSLYLFRHYYM